MIHQGIRHTNMVDLGTSESDPAWIQRSIAANVNKYYLRRKSNETDHVN